MAGLIIKEMKMRNQARRILIVAPGHLKDKWRREPRDRLEDHPDREILGWHIEAVFRL